LNTLLTAHSLFENTQQSLKAKNDTMAKFASQKIENKKDL